MNLTPDELLNKFCSLTVSLPEDAKLWPVQLCSLFLGALTSDLSDHVTTESGFTMPDLTTLTTKASQLTALCSIRASASKSYKTLNKQKEKMKSMIHIMQRGQQFNYHQAEYERHTNNELYSASHGQSLYQNSQSLAESTIASHSGNNNHSSNNTNAVKTKIHPKTRLLHPYYQPSDYLSDYPVTFKG